MNNLSCQQNQHYQNNNNSTLMHCNNRVQIGPEIFEIPPLIRQTNEPIVMRQYEIPKWLEKLNAVDIISIQKIDK